MPELTFDVAQRTAHPAAPIASDFIRKPADMASESTAAGPDSRQGLELAVITTRRAFDALEDDWNALFERAGASHQLFQTFNWCWHWCNHYLAQDDTAQELCIVTARRHGRLVMVWPMVREARSGLHIVRWLGEPASQYGDVLVEADDDSQALLEAGLDTLRRVIRPDAMVLRKVRSDAAVAPLLKKLEAQITERLQAPFADLTAFADFQAYEKSLESRDVRNRRRHRRRLAEKGELAIEIAADGPRASELAQRAVVLKRDWLRERGLVSRAFADQRLDAFFAAAASGTRPAGVEVAALAVAGAPVAIEIVVRCKSRTACHVKVYDQRWEKHSPGHLLTEDVIKSCIAGGTGTYDLLAPTDRYKLDWASGTVEVVDLAVPLSLKGRLYTRVYLGRLRAGLKTLLARMPLRLRQSLVQVVALIGAV